MSTWDGTVPPLNLKATEVYDTKRQAELREEAKRLAEEERQRVAAYVEAERARWRRLIGNTIASIAIDGDALRVTFENGTVLYVEPSEWCSYSLDETSEKAWDGTERYNWEDVLR